MADFDRAFAALLGNEGAYTVDDGGPTMWGITQAVARANGYTGDMQALPQATAKQIARSAYWNPIQGDSLPDLLAFQVFDAAYNSGVTPAVIWLQQAAGVKADGNLGPVTMAAIQGANPYQLIGRFDAYRLIYLASLSVWPTYSKGWVRRIANNQLKAFA